MNTMVLEIARSAGISPSLAHNVTSGRSKVMQEKLCRICKSRYDLTRHHLVPHSWFIKDKPSLRAIRNANANIVPLCERCHRRVDATKNPVDRLQKRAALRGALYSNEIAFILQVRGPIWLEEEYPRNP